MFLWFSFGYALLFWEEPCLGFYGERSFLGFHGWASYLVEAYWLDFVEDIGTVSCGIVEVNIGIEVRHCKGFLIWSSWLALWDSSFIKEEVLKSVLSWFILEYLYLRRSCITKERFSWWVFPLCGFPIVILVSLVLCSSWHRSYGYMIFFTYVHVWSNTLEVKKIYMYSISNGIKAKKYHWLKHIQKINIPKVACTPKFR